MADRQLNATAASLLGFLHLGPMSGWDLCATAQQLIGQFWSLTQSQVYRELSGLEQSGLIAAGPTGARERRPYHLTADGRTAFLDWLRTPPGAEQIRYPLLLTISFGRQLPPGELAAFVAAHRAQHANRLVGYRAARAAAGTGADPFRLATLDFGIRYEEAVLSWFDSLPPEVGGHEPPAT